jgi:hypothetical protein
VTFLYMKPIEQLFDWVPTFYMKAFPRITDVEIAAHQTPKEKRTEKIRMALEDNPIHQYFADLERIPFHGKEVLII